MDITDKLLQGASPFISTYLYDVLKRKLVIELVDDPEKMNPVKRVTFTGILQYSEDEPTDEPDDLCMDGVIGIHWINSDSICIKTDDKEVIIKVENEPFTEIIA
jgi:hypothetical protein